ncbi:MAG: histidine ammonia-lyase [Xanthomonadales bacterium]|nr:histidine ammonia-lyase [Gammaproteobacteria bacterium]MBT8052112.1 histidine ammonia-lyase [Gammaproteobacteria bacterium]MBT8056286.1 histidine ammonia-lyase [Gammaproteobacteria bacterium]NNJ79437.1 histidine ammonia-lyase [Xanthomonadales bacterium]NNL04472.1 histidine ammonia-lyase [Xanthomonadales bacterium]
MIRLESLYRDLEERMDALRAGHDAVERSRQTLVDAMASGRALYGINTGFGVLANKRIDDDQLSELQQNILLSHACGVGQPVPPPITRLMLQLKIHALGLGNSGISETTFRQLLAFEQHGLTPWVPSRGSVGASGDLAPLAHLCLPLIGRGEVWNGDESGKVNSRAAMQRLGLEAIELSAKDGLALINGTQLMTAYGAYVLERARVLRAEADILAAMSLEALQGSAIPFDKRIHEIRPHPGQQAVAANVRQLLEKSEILDAHRDCGRVQDPYCLRCVPQVHGASRDALAYAGNVIETELNSVTDNPLVFDNGDILSGGNFHGQPLALALDFAAMALAELASISERRTYLLLEGHDGLPKLLMQDTGVNSGFMIPQYTAAALVSENKILCHPASVDSIPTSLGQEDHVSMGSISALKLLDVLNNVEQVLAVESVTAAQALDFRSPLKPGRGVQVAHELLRKRIAHADRDYEVRADLDACAEILRRGELLEAVEHAIGPLA